MTHMSPSRFPQTLSEVNKLDFYVSSRDEDSLYGQEPTELAKQRHELVAQHPPHEQTAQKNVTRSAPKRSASGETTV